ncbi:hypothetical protein [Leptospira yanagawae]|nr:hypothetical protein [Leptospira yanagawae]
MNLSFTKKMVLDEEVVEDDSVTVYLRSYLKTNFIERMVKIKFLNFIPNHIVFTSYQFGNAIWNIGNGIVEANFWESEEELIERSNLTKHFQSSFENSSVTVEYAIKRIIPDTLSASLDGELTEKINELVIQNKIHNDLTWNQLLKNYRALSNEFIKNLENKI